MDDVSKILEAIGALDGKVDGVKADVAAVKTDVAGLKKTDETLATEVARLGEDGRRRDRELQDLRAETLRTFESERHASTQTAQAITKHVDDAAKTFHAKADKIDALETATAEQTQMLKAILGSPTVKRVGAAVAAFLVVALGYAGMRLQASVQKLEEKPTTVQAAPTVYVPVYVPVDGGAK